MIHDYMQFDKNILLEIVKERKYLEVYMFLIEKPNISETIQKRIASFGE